MEAAVGGIIAQDGEREPDQRFLCDAMLAQLARWLRAAGYDALIAGERIADRALVARAIADERMILTRDRMLCEIRHARSRVWLLRDMPLAALAAEITPHFRIDWLARPFSRCLVCNVELSAAPELARRRLPADLLATIGEIHHCRQCDRLYWPGSHVRRMLRRLSRWQAGDFI